MANIKSFPNNQDTFIGAEEVMRWHHGRTSGVFAGGNNAAVSALSTPRMAVEVSDGTGWLSNIGKDGIVWWVDEESVKGAKLQLVIDPADGVLDRVDRVIVEWRTTSYVDYPEVKILKGTASVTAYPPTLTNNKTVRQLSLAQVSVVAGTTAITASMITDERLDSHVCGLVTEQVNVDTSTMQAQFSGLLDGIQSELAELEADTAVELKKLLFQNESVSAASFVEDGTYEDYPYRAAVPLPNVIASMVPEVVFSVAAVSDNEFAAVSECYNGGVYIYANNVPDEDVTIDTIICWNGSGRSIVGESTTYMCTVNGQVPDGSGNITLLPEDLGALPAEGGSMSGNLLMDGNQIRELGEPTRDTDAATKIYVDGKRKCFLSQLETSWTGTGPYTQTIVLAQVKETDTPHITPVYDEDPETARSQMEAWQYVSFAKTQNGLIVFTCLDKQPETAIPLQIEVIS